MLSEVIDRQFGRRLERALAELIIQRQLRRVPNGASEYRETKYHRGVLATFFAPDLKLQIEMYREDIVLYGAPVSDKRGWGRLQCIISVPATRERPGYERDLVESDIPDLGRLLDERWDEYVAEVNEI